MRDDEIEMLLVAGIKDDRRKQLYLFKKTKTEKTKYMSTSKIPIRCKLVVDDKFVHQEYKHQIQTQETSDGNDKNSNMPKQRNVAKLTYRNSSLIQNLQLDQ